MPDSWSSTSAGKHLVGRRKINTLPEVLLRKALHAAGARFRLHRRIAKGCTPDIVLPGRKIAIFVDGCYWHSCPAHGRKKPFTGPNAHLWEDKMQRNRDRDIRSSALAVKAGWTVVRAWECSIRDDAAATARSALAGKSMSPSESGISQITATTLAEPISRPRAARVNKAPPSPGHLHGLGQRIGVLVRHNSTVAQYRIPGDLRSDSTAQPENAQVRLQGSYGWPADTMRTQFFRPCLDKLTTCCIGFMKEL